jgi:hypothetical protein
LLESEVKPVLDLAPFEYHADIVAYLKENEPEAWNWSQSSEVRQQQVDELRDSMLRNTYRLERETHASVYEACARAMTALEISAPVTLYQAADGMMNAALCYIPGEVHLIFYGPILEKLSSSELLALMGHELAHYLLWTRDEGAYLNAGRVFEHAISYPDTKPSHQETARLFSLYTELFADRGAALAAAEVPPAISLLVKTMTGMTTVDPDAYLRQARELDEKAERSDGQSHPEAFLRAQALDLWWNKADNCDDWINSRIRGPLSIETLDVLRQDELSSLTRGFFARVIKEAGFESEEALTQIRRFFPDFQSQEVPIEIEQIAKDKIDEATRSYFVALMFDCAMSDPDTRDELMLAAAKIARAMGAEDVLVTALKRDLKWPKAATDKLLVKAAKAA